MMARFLNMKPCGTKLRFQPVPPFLPKRLKARPKTPLMTDRAFFQVSRAHQFERAGRVRIDVQNVLGRAFGRNPVVREHPRRDWRGDVAKNMRLFARAQFIRVISAFANSTAAIAAHAGLDCCVFIPSDLEAGKVLGTLIYNPTLMAVKGNYDQVNRLCSEVGNTYGWGFVNINLRPYYSEGSKTLGFEVAEQLGWKLPDHVVAPLASGSLYTKIYKGFQEFVKVGLVEDKDVRFSGAQAEGCSPIAQAFKEGRDFVTPVKPNTIAKSIAIGNPADGMYALDIARKTNGNIESVTDAEIIEGMKLLEETEGIFTETAGGTTIAVLKKLVEAGKIDPEETTVAYITGNGLKTQEAVQGYVSEPLLIEPKLDSFERALERSRTLDRLEWQQVLV